MDVKEEGKKDALSDRGRNVTGKRMEKFHILRAFEWYVQCLYGN